MENAQDFKSLQDQIQDALLSVTRTAGQISSEDLNFQRSLNPSVGTALDQQSARLLVLSNSLLKSAASISELDVPILHDVEDVDNSWRGVVDVVDSLLEKADSCLDDYTGVIKRKTPPIDKQPPTKSKKYQSLASSLRTQNILKPQLHFLHKPDNATTTAWKPILTSKPHAKIPLTQSLGTVTDGLQQTQYDYTTFLPLLSSHSENQNLEGFSKSQRRNSHRRRRQLSTKDTSSTTNRTFRYKHPYETEILELQYPDRIYRKADPIPPQSVKSAKATFVDTFDGVLAMLAELKMAREIAVDLEHHDARSYVGLVSLMQISTREKNWIVDTLKPWRQDLQILNEVFADPNIIKVFHGAYMDIVWLQRDLGLYVVGLFDTHHASRVLGYPGGSLAYLLKRFVNFDADKKYQMADWRIRPLPEEMFFYAMTDTHFLLYIYDNMRNELVEQSNRTNAEENRIELVLQKSKETSLSRFERQVYDEKTGQGNAGWQNLLLKTPALLNNEQFAVFRAIHAWRDQVARKDDDSTHYVMPNHVIFTLAKLMPMDMISLYGAVHPISHNVKSRTADLLAIIKSAKDAGKDGPSMMDILRPTSIDATAKTTCLSAAADRKPDERDLGVNSVTIRIGKDQLRSDRSMFWGSAFGSTIWDPLSESKRKTMDFKLAVPTLHISSELSTGITTGSMDRSRLPNEPKALQEAPNTIINQGEEDAFTIKKGRKREAKGLEKTSHSLSSSPTGYDISLVNENVELAAEKAARRAERKAHKKAEKAARELTSGDGRKVLETDGDEEDTFDYIKAESVLHRKRKEGTDGSKPELAFDPYVKSSNAPKGMRRLQTERAGKSFTFKN